jgi:hypothetical protein
MRPGDSIAVRHAARAASALACIGAATGAALVPKCPLCVAAILSAAGFGAAGARHLAPFVRGSAFVFGASLAIAFVLFHWRRTRRPCCGKGGALR